MAPTGREARPAALSPQLQPLGGFLLISLCWGQIKARGQAGPAGYLTGTPFSAPGGHKGLGCGEGSRAPGTGSSQLQGVPGGRSSQPAAAPSPRHRKARGTREEVTWLMHEAHVRGLPRQGCAHLPPPRQTARTARARRTPEPRPAGSARGAQRSLEPGRRRTRQGQLEPGGLGGLRRSPGSQGMCSPEIRVQGRLGVGAWWLRESQGWLGGSPGKASPEGARPGELSCRSPTRALPQADAGLWDPFLLSRPGRAPCLEVHWVLSVSRTRHSGGRWVRVRL